MISCRLSTLACVQSSLPCPLSPLMTGHPRQGCPRSARTREEIFPGAGTSGPIGRATDADLVLRAADVQLIWPQQFKPGPADPPQGAFPLELAEDMPGHLATRSHESR